MPTRKDYCDMLVALGTDKLIDWYIANKPEYSGPLTFPRRWRNFVVRTLIAEHADSIAGVPHHRGFRLQVQTEDPVVSRREIRPFGYRSARI